MEAVAQTPTQWPRGQAWFRDFLKDELSPYPGRLAVVARMVLAAAVIMILVMTFNIPSGAYAALYGLTISREDPQATINAVKTNIIAFAYSAAFVLVGAMLFAGDPMLRLLWVVVALFTMSFGLSTLRNYTAAVRFGFMVVIIIPIWDQHITAEAKVEGTLWTVGALMLASLVTGALELLFEALSQSRDLLRSLAERLTAVEEFLRCKAEGRVVDQSTAHQLTRVSMLGTSRPRRVLQHSSNSLHYGEQMGAVVALVGRLVDITANLMQLNPQFTGNDRKRLGTLAGNLATIHTDLLAERVPLPIRPADNDYSNSDPLLGDLEKTVAMIPEVFTGLQSLSGNAPAPPGEAPPTRLLVADAFTNPEHVRFAIKGCLAASLCYAIYMLLGWPGISAAVTTCFLTALNTTGSSHQKQIFCITGALAGGAAAMLAQIFILPWVDSIAGFTVLFLVVSFAASWLITSGPRLSYFGDRFALAYFLINLSEFTIQTSLTPARDRVVGVLLGLTMMWLVFDQLWGAPAIVEMKRACVSLLRSVARLARAPLSNNLQVAIEQSYALRETVNNDFNKVRSLADGVLFEFGPSRQQDLALRSRIITWQPELRTLFISCVILLKYRLRLPDFELPELVRPAQREFENCLARSLDSMANRLEGRPSDSANDLKQAVARLAEAIRSSGTAAAERLAGQQLETFSALSEKITNLTLSLNSDIQNEKTTCATQ